MNPSVFATIVTYNPDIDMFQQNLAALIPQVRQVCIYDNHSANIEAIRALVQACPDTVRLVENADNLGLPINYNRAIKEAESMGCEWLLTMDQDSVLPEDYVQIASEHFDEADVAIIAPRYWDSALYSREEFVKKQPPEPVSYTKRCICSGSLCRISMFSRLGNFDEALYLDYVDFDYCERISRCGYRILRLNRCIMEHHVGASCRKHALGRVRTFFNHSAPRKFILFKSRMYFARKYHLLIWKNPRYYRWHLLSFVLIFFEDEDRPRKALMAIKGTLAGLTMKVKRWSPPPHTP